MVNPARDIFDEIAEEDPFKDVKTTEEDALTKITSDLMERWEQLSGREHRRDSRQIATEVKDLVRSEIAKIKPTQNIIERKIETKVIQPVHIEPRVIQAPAAPPQIVKEIRVEVEKRDTSKIEASIKSLESQIQALKKEINETREIADKPIIVPFNPGGSGVIGIPAPEPNPVGYVLTINDQKKAQWKETGGTLSGFTVNNGNTLQTFDVTDTTLDELARVVGTMITQLQS